MITNVHEDTDYENTSLCFNTPGRGFYPDTVIMQIIDTRAQSCHGQEQVMPKQLNKCPHHILSQRNLFQGSLSPVCEGNIYPI